MNLKAAAQSKQQAIVNAARELFEKFSFEKTTMEDIARAVPMSKATLYKEFSNKNDILLAICLDHCDRVDQVTDEAIRKSKAGPLETLKVCLRTTIDATYDLVASMQSPEALIYTLEKLEYELTEYFEQRRKLVEQQLNRAVQDGEISSDIDCRQMSEILVECIWPYLPPYRRHATKTNVRPEKKLILKQFDLMIDILITGLKHKH